MQKPPEREAIETIMQTFIILQDSPFMPPVADTDPFRTATKVLVDLKTKDLTGDQWRFIATSASVLAQTVTRVELFAWQRADACAFEDKDEHGTTHGDGDRK